MHTTFEEIKAQIHNSTFAFLHHSSASHYMRTRFVHTRARFRKKRIISSRQKNGTRFLQPHVCSTIDNEYGFSRRRWCRHGHIFFIFIFSLLFKTKIKRLSIHRLPDNLEKTLPAVQVLTREQTDRSKTDPPSFSSSRQLGGIC